MTSELALAKAASTTVNAIVEVTSAMLRQISRTGMEAAAERERLKIRLSAIRTNEFLNSVDTLYENRFQMIQRHFELAEMYRGTPSYRTHIESADQLARTLKAIIDSHVRRLS